VPAPAVCAQQSRAPGTDDEEKYNHTAYLIPINNVYDEEKYNDEENIITPHI
jgi:hypothetical protein